MADKPKVLVIDDEPDARELIKGILDDKFTVLSAPDGEEGLRVARDQLPQVILLDIIMPGLDGVAVCERLRASAVTRAIPIIVLTGSHDVEHRLQSFLTGADEFLTKPFQPRQLLALVSAKTQPARKKKS